ncbi:MAG: hypothetical protein JWO26_215 [Rhodospirillales bacterium]|jgi:hypothetical protein|nr:hypothetical protein [Rhodospirillales bacterium]MDB5380583.1 hypothetical protein [Rhodospirillales bacterium]
MTRRDWTGLLIALAALAAMLAYREIWVEPRAWGAICAASPRPFACEPRAALLWLQHWQLWGGGALVLGIWAFLGGPHWVRVAALALGMIATVNFNATWGMLGAALGVWAALSPRVQVQR